MFHFFEFAFEEKQNFNRVLSITMCPTFMQVDLLVSEILAIRCDSRCCLNHESYSPLHCSHISDLWSQFGDMRFALHSEMSFLSSPHITLSITTGTSLLSNQFLSNRCRALGYQIENVHYFLWTSCFARRSEQKAHENYWILGNNKYHIKAFSN